MAEKEVSHWAEVSINNSNVSVKSAIPLDNQATMAR